MTNHSNHGELQKTRAEAWDAGAKLYCSGLPCKHGHTAPRQTRDYKCVECNRIRAATTMALKYKENPERYREYHKSYSQAKPQVWHRAHLKRQYGMTRETYQAFERFQGGRCAVCGTHEPGTLGQHKRHHWSVDHCHATGRIRGLLCSHCNTMLGHASDSSDVLLSAIRYLEQSATASPMSNPVFAGLLSMGV